MTDNTEAARGTHIDRRNLLKKAGAAGALGLAAPVAFDSFFSPASACSADDMAAVALLSNNDWAGDGNATGGTADEAFADDRSPDRSQRYRNTTGFDLPARSLVILAITLDWRSATVDAQQPGLPLLSNDGGLSFGTPIVNHFDDFEGPETGHHGFQMIFSAQNDTDTPITGVHVVIDLGSARSDAFIGQVIGVTRAPVGAPAPAVSGTPTPVVALNQALSSGTPFAEVTGALAPVSTASGELMVVSGLFDDTATDNSLQAATWSAAGYAPPLADKFVDGGTLTRAGVQAGASWDISQAAFYRASTSGSRTARVTAGATPAGSGPALDLLPAVAADLGATVLEISCA